MSLLTSACASTGASLVLVTHDPAVAARLGCSRGIDLADVGTMVAFLERCSHYTLEELEVLLGVSGALSLDGAQRHALGREGLHFVIC